MGKIYTITDPETGQKKYPVTVGDAVVVGQQNLTEIVEGLPTKVSDLENDEMFSALRTAMPIFDNLQVQKTIEFDIAATTYYRILTCNNTLSQVGDLVDEYAYFRITITSDANATIYAIIDVAMNYKVGLGTNVPYYLTLNRTNSTTGATTGIRYMRYVYPTDMYSGKDFGLDLSAYNATARHIKIEVFECSSGITFKEELTAATVASDETSGTWTLYTTRGIQSNMFTNVTVSAASSAAYISTLVPLSMGTLPLAGEALLASSLAFISTDGRVYPTTISSRPINGPGALNAVRSAVSKNAAVAYTTYGSKMTITSATNVPPISGTLVRGKPVYLRCTHQPQIETFNAKNIPQTLTGRYYSMGAAAGTVVSMTGTSSSGWRGYMCECKEGDVVIITCAPTGTNAKGWAFLDADNKIISVCDGVFILSEEIIIAPPGTAKVVSNNKTGEQPRLISREDIQYSTTRLNIYSDNLLTQIQEPGYSYIRVGWASDTVMNVDTTGSNIHTLDEEGHLTHIDGVKILPDLSGYVPKADYDALLKRVEAIESKYIAWG